MGRRKKWNFSKKLDNNNKKAKQREEKQKTIRMEDETGGELNIRIQTKILKKKQKKKKRDKITKISTWNVRTMLTVGKMTEISSELKKYDIHIAGLQEIRWKGSGQISNEKYTILYSGDKKQGQYGVAFMVINKMQSNILQFKPINERLAYIRMKATPFNISILNAYAPTENARIEEKEKFYEKMEEETEKIPTEDIIIIIGDMNAQVGKEEYIKEVAGKHTLHETSNDNGQRLCNFAVKQNMIVSSTKHKHPLQHKVTWMSHDQKLRSQIDHVLINKRRQSSMRDVRTYRGANADTDHYMVSATIQQKIKILHKSKNKQKRWNTNKLNNDETRAEYTQAIEFYIAQNERRGNNIGEEWDKIKSCITKAAEEKLGTKERENRKKWYNEECKTISERKRKARIKWIQTNKDREKEEYVKIRKECSRVLRKNKRVWMEEKLEFLEEESMNRNTKRFYQEIKRQKPMNKIKITYMKDKNGKISETELEQKQTWKDYFKELLTEENINMEEENEYKEDENEEEEEREREATQEPTIEEVKNVIAKSKNGKAPGIDGINMELIKHGGEEIITQIHQLITKIWREEEIPKDWEIGQVIMIYKKGDPTECKNYRGITLLNTAYKILSTIIQKRLTISTNNRIGQYQCGFVKGRSTIDAIHTLKQIMEKVHNAKIEIEMLFIDFKQAFDSIKRGKLMKALKELNIEAKLRRLVRMTMENSRICIKTDRGDTEMFTINKGVRQGDALSATLFNFAIEYATRKINRSSIRKNGGQIIAYADDVVIITKRRDIMENMIEEIIYEGNKIGLQINESKTKMMRCGKKKGENKIKIGEHEFIEVDKYNYLGVMITNTGDRETEIKEKIFAANKAYHIHKNLLKSKIISKRTKMKIYKTLIRPLLLYDAETLTMTKIEEEKMRIIERKILRAILGPIKISNDEWRRRMNNEILKEIDGEDIVKKIKQQRVKWLGHVWRAGQEAVIKSMLIWDPGRKRRGRPRSTWIKEVEEDLKHAGITNWKQKTGNRKIWREISMKI